MLKNIKTRKPPSTTNHVNETTPTLPASQPQTKLGARSYTRIAVSQWKIEYSREPNIMYA